MSTPVINESRAGEGPIISRLLRAAKKELQSIASRTG